MTNSDDFGFGGAIPDGWSTGSLLDYIRRGLQEPPQALVFPDINLIKGAPGAWPIRDQGKIRSTCNAFAVVAAEELYLWRQTGESRPHMLSEEFVYNRMRLEYEPTFSDPTKPPDAGVEAGGTFLDEAAQVLKNDGICAASLMPYQRHIDFGPAHTADLHPNALDDAAARKTEVVVNGWTGPRFDMDPDKWRKPLNGRILSDILVEQLQGGKPVAVSFPVLFWNNTTNWTSAAAQQYGIVTFPKDTPFQLVGGHTVCIVGCTTTPVGDDGRMFLFRNSHGQRFAQDLDPADPDPPGSIGVGYGMISLHDVDNFCWEFLYRADPPDQPQDPPAAR